MLKRPPSPYTVQIGYDPERDKRRPRESTQMVGFGLTPYVGTIPVGAQVPPHPSYSSNRPFAAGMTPDPSQPTTTVGTGYKPIKNQWARHLKEFRAAHPTLSLKEAMRAASKIYKK